LGKGTLGKPWPGRKGVKGGLKPFLIGLGLGVSIPFLVYQKEAKKGLMGGLFGCGLGPTKGGLRKTSWGELGEGNHY